MRRLATAGTALLVATGVVLVLPVTGPSTPAPRPVETSVTEVALGSTTEPAEGVVVEQSAGGGPDAPEPTLRVSRPDVASFSLVGVTWAQDVEVVDVAVRIRARDDDGTWSTWTAVGIEDAMPDGGGTGGRAGTEPLWTGDSSGVEAEVTTRSGASPVDVRLNLIDPGSSPADAVPGIPDIQDAADASAAMPPVYSRAQWGADEKLRTWKPEYAGFIKAATIHHTTNANGYAADEVAEIMRGIYHYHAVVNEWGDIGYNVLVDRFGRLWEGRAGGLSSTVIGAHAGGFNTGTFGVSMIGNYDLVDTPPAMINSLASIVAWKLSLYGVDPRGSVTLTSLGSTRYAEGVKVTLPTIFGHGDVSRTACPGQYGWARMPQIRSLVAGDYVDVTKISDRYESDTAAQTLLGSVVKPPALTADGTGAYADYTGGSLYYSAATGVRLVRGQVRSFWRSTGAERGVLDFPTADVAGTGDGVGDVGRFRGGSIWWSPETGARSMQGAIGVHYANTGGATGPLGYPTKSVSWLADGVGQFATFQDGSVYWSPATGARTMMGEVGAHWSGTGGVGGPLGYPTSSVQWLPDRVGQYATFQRGSVYWSPTTGARTMFNEVGAHWAKTGGVGGPLGYPTSSVQWLPDRVGQFATFQGGSVYWSPTTGARTMMGRIEQVWLAQDAEAGPLGYPTSSVLAAADGVSRYAHFENGTLWTADGSTVIELGREVRDAWVAAGADRGRLGGAVSGEAPVGDARGRQAVFAGGSIHWTPETGAHVLTGPIDSRYSAEGAGAGALGYPTEGVRATADGRGEVGRFENGAIYASAATGARVVRGPVRDFWELVGAEGSVLRLPVADVAGTGDGIGEVGRFEGGSIWWSPETGARSMQGAIGTHFANTGGATGPLGYPTRSVSWLADGVGQFATFQDGSVYWSPATGARTMMGEVGAHWLRTGGVRGPLGYPTSSVQWAPDRVGQFATFQRGSVYWSPTTGARTMMGAIGTLYSSTGGVSGSLGYPTLSVSWLADRVGQYAVFQRGGIWWKPATGAHALRGVFLTAYRNAGAERGGLGYPTRGAYGVTGGTRMDFERGTITVSSSTGRATVTLR